MLNYHVFEIETELSYHAGASSDEQRLMERFEQLLRLTEQDEDVTYGLGTVEAESVEDALDRLRSGQCSLTHRL